jgi:8-oxo-dGTP pyrophosphatase MutT (NUDIX family)
MAQQDKEKKGKETQHRNDMYGNIDARGEGDEGVSAPIPAATVVLLRDGSEGVEVLMLRKNSKITFGGMWVFPGGKLDAEDYPADGDTDMAARTAAARETQEEAGIVVSKDSFQFLAHWTPPPGPQKRFATWFFTAQVDGDQDIAIDDGEIKDHAWLNPAQALQRHAKGEIDLVPPTWITLYHLSQYSPAAAIISHFKEHVGKTYNTRVVKSASGDRVAMWVGDAGYDQWDAEIAGERHRLVMAENGFVFENTVEVY